MKRNAAAIGVIIAHACLFTIVTSSTAMAYSVKQYIAPLECVIDHLNDGSNQTVILSPDDCYDYLNPEAPISPGGDGVVTPPDNNPVLPTDSLNELDQAQPALSASSDSDDDDQRGDGSGNGTDEQANEKQSSQNNNVVRIEAARDTYRELIVIGAGAAAILLLHGRRLVLYLRHWYNNG